jgi:glycosyltransferase involved in cell wall biosynthesis
LVVLHELFPKAVLYTSVYNRKKAQWARDFSVRPSFLQNIPYAQSSHEYFAPFMPFFFEKFSFEKYDVVISISSDAAKGIITHPQTFHLHYSLTPTRYLWSGYDEYFKDQFLRILSAPIIWYLRKWDTVAAQRPDVVISISQEVQRRVKKYYHRESEVLYPAVQIEETSKRKMPISARPYFLVVSRLVSYKRVDLAVKACTMLHLPLIVIGSGAQAKKLKNIAGPTIEFKGNLTDEELIEYYKSCQALIFPGVEDFGLVVIEAQIFGKPVIAYGKGGALETIVKGKTGEFFYEQTVESLIEILQNFNPKKYKKEDCIKQVQKFTKTAFKKQFLEFLMREYRNYQKI